MSSTCSDDCAEMFIPLWQHCSEHLQQDTNYDRLKKQYTVCSGDDMTMKCPGIDSVLEVRTSSPPIEFSFGHLFGKGVATIADA
jgi:hypothetical protein